MREASVLLLILESKTVTFQLSLNVLQQAAFRYKSNFDPAAL